MANKHRLALGFPFPVLVNETATKQRIAPGVLVNETIAGGGGGGGTVVPIITRQFRARWAA